VNIPLRKCIFQFHLLCACRQTHGNGGGDGGGQAGAAAALAKTQQAAQQQQEDFCKATKDLNQSGLVRAKAHIM
jgi:hypothetical protein